MKTVFVTALTLGCFGLSSFTSTDNAVDAIDSISIGGSDDPCPEGDMWICYRSANGGTTYRGALKPIVID
jgi:hypothetical protein